VGVLGEVEGRRFDELGGGAPEPRPVQFSLNGSPRRLGFVSLVGVDLDPRSILRAPVVALAPALRRPTYPRNHQDCLLASIPRNTSATASMSPALVKGLAM